MYSEATKERINAMPYLDFLREVKETVGRLTHFKKSNNAYLEANELIKLIINKFLSENNLTHQNYYESEYGNMLRLDKEILNDYSYKDSDKRKEQVITEFKDELLMDLDRIIFEVESRQKSS